MLKKVGVVLTDEGVQITQGQVKVVLTKEQAVSLAKQIIIKLMP